MAVLFDGMLCPLCQGSIDIESAEYIAFPCVGLTESRYEDLDDAAVHCKCLNGWRKRDHFVELFNQALSTNPRPLPYRLIVSDAGEVAWSDVS